jgi:hypothetical protein
VSRIVPLMITYIAAVVWLLGASVRGSIRLLKNSFTNDVILWEGWLNLADGIRSAAEGGLSTACFRGPLRAIMWAEPHHELQGYMKIASYIKLDNEKRIHFENSSLIWPAMRILFFLMLIASTSGISTESPIMGALTPESTEIYCVVEHTADETFPYEPQFNRSGLNFSLNADARLGKWKSYVDYQPIAWKPGARVKTSIKLSFTKDLFETFSEEHQRIDGVCILLTAERDFDSNGQQHTPWNEKASTLLTPTGLPIMGGSDSALSRFSGSSFRTPVDIMLEAPISTFDDDESSGWYKGTVNASFDLPPELPPGIYRLRLDLGFKSANGWYNFNGDGIGRRPKNPNDVSCLYSPPIAASGKDITGNMINGSEIHRRSYWVLLGNYSSNGYQGVVAQEDQERVAISPGNIIHDEVVLPRFDDKGEVIEYNLEPDFLFNSAESQRDIPWRYDRGEWRAKLILPNGTKVDLGSSPFLERRGDGATTKNQNFTNWKPPCYGKYTLQAEGWIEDIWGNRYDGGGNYSFWIAERLTLATATFPGQPYQVGNSYGRDIAFFPSVPANVTITANLFVNSDPNNVRTMKSTGNATISGIYGSAQGLKYLRLNAPGEYRAKITATYWDLEGNLWVAVMTHAGVVYPEDTPIIAHGKKLLAQGKLVDRGERRLEGNISENGTVHTDYMNYPYNSWDCMLIACDQHGSNVIVPVLTYEEKGATAPSDQALQPVGRSNLRISTSNWLSPYMFPEFITDMNYFYASGVRPGLVARFIVAEDNATGLSWPTGMSDFGGQYGASNNGEMPGAIYRLLGGVVLRPVDLSPEYAGYQASAFILPEGTNNNRVIGPGDEDLPSPDGKHARFFLVPARAGSVYEQGWSFPASFQIDPILPCEIQINLFAPNGSERIAKCEGSSLGYAAPKENWIMDQPGVWTYKINATWNGHPGRVPGLPEDGEYIFVLEKGDSTGPGLTLNLSSSQTFSPITGLEICGNSSASQVYYTAITPGAILDEGILPVKNGEFAYKFDPRKMADKIKIYDVMNLTNGKPEIGRIVHLTFFSREMGSNGPYHSFARVILRGTTASYVKEGSLVNKLSQISAFN